jgi:hypothetical protein
MAPAVPHSAPADYTATLRQSMAAANLSSFRALSQQARVPIYQIRLLRQGQIQRLSLGSLLGLSQALGVGLADLVATFSESDLQAVASTEDLGQGESVTLNQDEVWQRQSLATLEPLLRYWPTLAYAASQNPALPLTKMLPFLQSLETLLTDWGVEAVAPSIGETIAYNPQQHQLMQGQANPGDPVRLRYQGYTHHGKLLFRAQVSP